jgi:hypothetical protein
MILNTESFDSRILDGVDYIVPLININKTNLISRVIKIEVDRSVKALCL